MADKTYVPGMDAESASRPAADAPARRPSPTSKSDIDTGKPVLGFLYSVSRTSFGEFWPLYLGPNTIGRDASCDVILQEGTVSGEHATLIIHQEDDGEVYAGVKDNGSTHGVKVNGKSAHFDVVGCNNMDIIKIGKAYELLFILVDSLGIGLKPAENFVQVQTEKTARPVDRRIFSGPGRDGASPSTRFANPASGGSDRTRAMDGNDDNPGEGTVTR